MASFRLFQAFGVELEYMIVDSRTLDVRPVADRLLRAAAELPGGAIDEGEDPEWPGGVTIGEGSISNELTAHIAEFKTAAPAASLEAAHRALTGTVAAVRPVLESLGCTLLPGGMHPWMNPDREMTLWQHGCSEIYRMFDRIFDCRGHGWANLQACHLNLPFALPEGRAETAEDEFGRLHAAIRCLLPILPALSAGSPYMDGRATGMLDNRLEVYRVNSRKIPQAAGRVIPERAYTRADYQKMILEPIYEAYAPHDPEGLLRNEFANSRGCIARFVRNAIEIRVLDVQECPAADIAICEAITAVLRAATEGRLGDLAQMRAMDVEPMHALLLAHIREGERATVADGAFLDAWGVRSAKMESREVWAELLSKAVGGGEPAWMGRVRTILERGPLARRMLRIAGASPTKHSLHGLCERMADCLLRDAMLE